MQKIERYQSGQMEQTVNLLAYAFAGSYPARPTMVNNHGQVQSPVIVCEVSEVATNINCMKYSRVLRI